MLLFTTSWCNPCKDLKQWLEVNKLTKDIEFIDVEANEALVVQHGIKSVPSLVVGTTVYTGREQIKPFILETLNDK